MAHAGGQPRRLTPEIAAGIVTLIQHAVPPVTAAGAYGVARSTYYQWVALGETVDENGISDPMYTEFADNVRRAEYEAESTLVGVAVQKIKTTADAVTLLERRFPDRWQRREELTINLRREAEKIAAATGLDPDQIVAEAEAIIAGARK